MANWLTSFLPKSWIAPQQGNPVEISNGSANNYVAPETLSANYSSGAEIWGYDNGKYLKAAFDMAWLPVLDHLAIYNSDVSYAVSNVVDLANTKFDIYYSGVSDAKAKEMNKHLENVWKTWYPYSTGIGSLKNDLLRQLAITGTISAEKVLDSRLGGVKRVKLIDAWQIIFEEAGSGNYNIRQKVKDGNPKLLSQATFSYITLQRSSSNPYGIPPILSALEGLKIQRGMLNSLTQVSEKIGLFGFLSVLLTPPPTKPGETQEQYIARCQKHIQEAAPEIKKMTASGFGVGFKGTHEFNFQNGNLSADNAAKIMKIVEGIVIPGLKQDPNLLGRQQSTTETFGRVLLSKMMTQLTTYQEALATFFESVFLTELQLAGYPVQNITVEFKRPMIGDELKEQQSYGYKIDNLRKLYDDGVISQEQRARELGYDGAYLGAPRSQQQQPDGSNATPPTNDGRTNPERDVPTEMPNKSFDPFVDPPVEYLPFSASASMSPYEKAVSKLYNKSAKEIVEKIMANLKAETKVLTLEELQDRVFFLLNKHWTDIFVSKLPETITKHIEKAYFDARGDKSIFPATAESNSRASFEGIPDAEPDLFDFQVFDFNRRADSFFLGKIATDESAKNRLYAYLTKNYILKDRPISSDPKQLKELKEGLESSLQEEVYKIRRVVDTSLTRSRTFGNINYMDQANVQFFEIAEPNDSITCEHCKEMNGKRFSISKAKSRIKNMLNSSVENIGDFFPFATSMKIEDFKALTNDELEKQGFISTPFHPLCRGRVVATF